MNISSKRKGRLSVNPRRNRKIMCDSTLFMGACTYDDVYSHEETLYHLLWPPQGETTENGHPQGWEIDTHNCDSRVSMRGEPLRERVSMWWRGRRGTPPVSTTDSLYPHLLEPRERSSICLRHNSEYGVSRVP